MEEEKFIHESDKEIREWVKENILISASSVEFYEERFTIMDGEFFTKNHQFRQIEIKNRHCLHTRYDTTFIEMDKYQYIKDKGNCVLCILFDDGVLYYTPEDIKKNKVGMDYHRCPDQKNPETNKWVRVYKECMNFKIDESRFFPYSNFKTIPTRERKPSEYYD